MARRNDEVGGLLQEYADLLRITGGKEYKARVYEKAARAVAGHHEDVAKLGKEGLQQIAGVGSSIAAKIAGYLETGHMEALDELHATIPAGVRNLISIPTLGPRKAMVLYEELGIASVEELVDAIHAQRLRDLKGFGAKTEEQLLHGVQLLQLAGDRVHINVAMDLAEEIVGELSAVPGCRRCAYAGSLRRYKETIGDVDILAAGDGRAASRITTVFSSLPYVDEVIATGGTKTSVRTTKGLQVDLRIVPPESWGAALQYFTGSKGHNIRIREIAVQHKLKLSEYGLFDAATDEVIVSETEEQVYERLGMPWIPPPLREDRGEIEAARRGELPELVTEQDLCGDLHTHTNLTDGLSSLEEMVKAAAARGYAYYAITDHAPNLYMQRMSDEKMLAQRERVRALDGRYGKMRLLHGTELNIGPDGSVDWPPAFLDGFDVCVASVHSHFDQDRDTMTKRLLRAIENPHVDIIGHPTGRQIGRRAGIDADLDKVYQACARTGTVLEINAYPDRLDLNDDEVLRAKRYGVKFAIDSDAHSTVHLPFIRYGVGTAQRGWLTAEDVVNTWPLRRLRSYLSRHRQAQKSA
jgi:DNA polymerase (family X)